MRPLELAPGAMLAFAFASVVACGDIYADPEIVLSPTSSVDAGAAPPEPVIDCPTKRPRENTLCMVPGSTCEYGTSADTQCNIVLSCRGTQSDGAWESSLTETCRANVCPKTADTASVENTPCTLDPPDGGAITDADEAICNVSDGVCACTTGPSGAAHARVWKCARPVSSCPPNRPLAGQPCVGSLWCDYGSCAFKRGSLMECKNGRWLAGGNTCP